jgi:double-stranded uracil-DNA glycosylase
VDASRSGQIVDVAGDLARLAAALRLALPYDEAPQVEVDGGVIEVLVHEQRSVPRIRRAALDVGIPDATLRIIRPVMFLYPYPTDGRTNEAALQELHAANVRWYAEGLGVQLTGMHPIVSAESRILILGSMPGEVSLKTGEYYANRQNRFWRIMETILGIPNGESWQQRTRRMTLAGVALWDVLKHCSRVGSLDSRILPRTEVPNDFADFLERHSAIDRIVFNGQKAAHSYNRLVEENLPADVRNRLRTAVAPSTSAANAKYTLAALVDSWREALGVTT